MNTPNHTPRLDPLKVIPHTRDCNKWMLLTDDGIMVGIIDCIVGEDYARRICDTFNALAGLNPSAVKGVVEVLRWINQISFSWDYSNAGQRDLAGLLTTITSTATVALATIETKGEAV